MLFKFVLIGCLFLAIYNLTSPIILVDDYVYGSIDNSNFKNNSPNDIIKSNFLTYSNQSLNLVLDYPDSWSITTIGNDTLAIISPIDTSGIVINKMNLQNLDQFLYERTSLQRQSLPGFQLIESKDLPINDEKQVKLFMYIFNHNQNSFKANEIIFNGNDNATYHFSFISNSSLFDTIAPAVNKMLTSLTILEPKNNIFKGDMTNEVSENTINQSSSISVIKNNTIDKSKNFQELGSVLSILAGAATQGNPAYYPDPIYVSKGKAITVTNDDTAPNTVTSGSNPGDPDSGKLFDTSIIMPGASAEIDTSGLDTGYYPYHCTVHPFMKGLLIIEE